MSTNRSTEFLHEGTSESIIKAFYSTYNRLGAGFLESVYRRAMAIELAIHGLSAVEEFPVSVHYRGIVVGNFRTDLLVNDEIMVELKAAEQLHPRHSLQLRNVLRATSVELGLLLNFGPRPAFKRLILMNRNKQNLETPSGTIGVFRRSSALKR